jgi:hypothetical protein
MNWKGLERKRSLPIRSVIIPGICLEGPHRNYHDCRRRDEPIPPPSYKSRPTCSVVAVVLTNTFGVLTDPCISFSVFNIFLQIIVDVMGL